METTHNHLFKIILIGDSGVGKTSLMKRYTDNAYTEEGASTIGVDFKIKTVIVGNKTIKLQIWDTAGQERFKAIVAHYYRGADGIFLVFDTTNKDSFDHLKTWMAELDKRDVPKTTEIIILGNKIDDVEHRQVAKEDIEAFLTSHCIAKSNFHEVSAKEDINVEDSFLKLTTKLVEIHSLMAAKVTSKLVFKKKDANKRNGCC